MKTLPKYATVTSFPHPVRIIENTWITLADGTRLAARIWMPEDAGQNPVPAILEYLPYRKTDGTAIRDRVMHEYLAGHGYACIRVDMRGSGDSDGLLMDEYLPQEQQDALEVIAWIARSGLVHWKSGDDGDLVGRIQQLTDRCAPSAGIKGHHNGLLNGRSVHG